MRIGFVIALAAVLPVSAAGPGVSAPAGLRCEYLANPEGIDSEAPRLSWLLRDTRRGAKQTAYQIQVASSAGALAAGRGDLWDSGKVQSSETIQVPYAGKPLAAGQQCFWRVRVWDAQGVPSSWSAPARWSMGLLERAQWKARWITDARAAERVLAYPRFGYQSPPPFPIPRLRQRRQPGPNSGATTRSGSCWIWGSRRISTASGSTPRVTWRGRRKRPRTCSPFAFASKPGSPRGQRPEWRRRSI
jgi:hypothetical protein